MSTLSRREVVCAVLDGKRPPYVPWNFGFTLEAHETLAAHFGTEDVDEAVGNHFLGLGAEIGFFEDVGNEHVRDIFGVVWDRTVDKDIGIVSEYPITSPTLDGYTFPDPCDARYFADIPQMLETHSDRFRLFRIGFSLYERAWTMRGMENLMIDFMMNPGFVHELLTAIADWNLAQIEEALKYDIDAVYFGDDWGQQRGLIMGIDTWRTFIKPQLARMYGRVRDAGKYVFIHSCGDVDELFEDLVDIGLNCFNPFQPEVMNIWELLPQYRGRLTFHGGLSTQRTLPQGTVADVEDECRRLLELGADGSYILSPAHAVESDVPLDNMLAFIRMAQGQSGYQGPRIA